jgi:hypothetical protein
MEIAFYIEGRRAFPLPAARMATLPLAFYKLRCCGTQPGVRERAVRQERNNKCAEIFPLSDAVDFLKRMMSNTHRRPP